jgi:hypothetical protein
MTSLSSKVSPLSFLGRLVLEFSSNSSGEKDSEVKCPKSRELI